MPRCAFSEFGPLSPQRVYGLIVDRHVTTLGRDLAGNLLSVLTCVGNLHEALSLTLEALCANGEDFNRKLAWSVTAFEPLDAPEHIGAAVYAVDSDGRSGSGRRLARFAARIEAGVRTLQSQAWEAAAQPRLLPVEPVHEPWLPVDGLLALEARRRLCLAGKSKRVLMQRQAEAPLELDLPILDDPAPLPEDDIVVEGVVDALKHSGMLYEVRGKLVQTAASAGATPARVAFGGSIPDVKTFVRLAELLRRQDRARFRLRPLRAARPQAQYVYELRSIFAANAERSKYGELADPEPMSTQNDVT